MLRSMIQYILRPGQECQVYKFEHELQTLLQLNYADDEWWEIDTQLKKCVKEGFLELTDDATFVKLGESQHV